MRIFNQDKTQELTEYDTSLGRLESDSLTIHHDAVAGVDEVGHYETIAEYPNGGKDVRWVVDVEGVAARDAYDEEEDVLVYVPYTDAELARIRASEAIERNKQDLADSDYAIIKFMDSYIKGNPALFEEFASQYPQLLEARESARAAINASERVLSEEA